MSISFLSFLIPNKNVTGNISAPTSQWTAPGKQLCVCVCVNVYEGVCECVRKWEGVYVYIIAMGKTWGYL